MSTAHVSRLINRELASLRDDLLAYPNEADMWQLPKGLPNSGGNLALHLIGNMWFLAIFVPIQVVLGDMHGLNTLEHQPAKLAAIEAHWNEESHAPLALFALPDQDKETNHAVIEVPELGSLILTSGDNLLAIRGEHCGVNRLRVSPKGAYLLAGLRIPHLRGAIIAPGDDPLAIWRERY